MRLWETAVVGSDLPPATESVRVDIVGDGWTGRVSEMWGDFGGVFFFFFFL